METRQAQNPHDMTSKCIRNAENPQSIQTPTHTHTHTHRIAPPKQERPIEPLGYPRMNGHYLVLFGGKEREASGQGRRPAGSGQAGGQASNVAGWHESYKEKHRQNRKKYNLLPTSSEEGTEHVHPGVHKPLKRTWKTLPKTRFTRPHTIRAIWV